MTKENKREQILSALERLLPGRRFHEITLEEVSREAQVGKGTIYLYFQDKDALFVEMICFRLEKLAGELSQLAGCSIDKLPARVFDMVGGFIHHHRSWFGAIGDLASHVARMTGVQREAVINRGKMVLNALAGVMKSSMPEWSDAEARSNAQTLLWMIDGCCRSEIAERDDLPSVDFLTGFFLRGAGVSSCRK